MPDNVQARLEALELALTEIAGGFIRVAMAGGTLPKDATWNEVRQVMRRLRDHAHNSERRSPPPDVMTLRRIAERLDRDMDDAAR